MSRAHSHPPQEKGHSHDEHHHPGLSVEVEKQPGKAAVKVSIAADELERARGHEFAQLARRVALKGFRPGKTPRALLERHYGAEVEKSVAEHFLQHAYQKAVSEHELRPAAYPRIPLGADTLPVKGAAWSIAFEILLRPEFELGQLDGLEVEGHPTAVADDEVERALVEIRRANARAEPAGEEPLAPEGMAVATLDFFRPGTSASCLTRDGIRLSPKNPPPGMDAQAFEEALSGARAGEERTLSMQFPANFPLEEARGERGSVRFHLKEVLRVVQPSDQELYTAFEVTDDAGLRTNLRARMEKSKLESEEQRIETVLLERLIAEHPLELPQQLVDDQVAAHEAELLEELEKQGTSPEEARTRAEGERERARQSAVKSLRAVYLIEEIARKKELEVTRDDVSAEITAIAERNGTQPAEVAKYYGEQGLMRQLGLELLERKVRRYLRTSAAIRPPA